MEDLDLNSIPARALNHSTRQLLGNFLNVEQKLLSRDGYVRDYRGLAEQMNFLHNDIRNFQRHEEPTSKVLEAWEIDASATIGKLIQYLENMGRHDAIEDLQTHFVKDAKVYMQKMEQLQESPLQVPEVTSCRIQQSYVNDSNILTCDDADSGECTLYDAYLSYADEDIPFAYNLVRYLEADGFKLFVRTRDMLGGHFEYDANMKIIKERCKRVLVVLSPDFVKSPSCEVQASFAAGLGFEEKCRKIIPILWKPCEIPLILQYVSKIDFTKPNPQDWIWDKLKRSLRENSSSVFMSPERRLAQGHVPVPQLDSSIPDSCNPAITFPTSSCNFNVEASSSNISEILPSDNHNDSALSVSKSSSLPKQKNKLHNLRFWHTKKDNKKRDLSSNFSSSISVSSSNATSGFHSQSGSVFESIEGSNEACSQDTPV